jgi:hypothetical protein
LLSIPSISTGILIGSAALAVAVRAYIGGESVPNPSGPPRVHNQPAVTELKDIKNETAIERASVLPVAQDAPNERLRTERVTAFTHGFEPDELTRPPGAFMLCVDNRAGTEALSITLISTDTNRVIHAAPIRRGSSGTNKVLNLAPGVYTLKEDSHPQWFCTITITNR